MDDDDDDDAHDNNNNNTISFESAGRQDISKSWGLTLERGMGRRKHWMGDTWKRSPNLRTMDSRSACIQGVLKVKVKVKSDVIRALLWILGMSYSVNDGLVLLYA